jgi:hypothetical protein
MYKENKRVRFRAVGLYAMNKQRQATKSVYNCWHIKLADQRISCRINAAAVLYGQTNLFIERCLYVINMAGFDPLLH